MWIMSPTETVPELSASNSQNVTVNVILSASPPLEGETPAFFNHGVSVSTVNVAVLDSSALSWPSKAVTVTVISPPRSVVKSDE